MWLSSNISAVGHIRIASRTWRTLCSIVAGLFGHPHPHGRLMTLDEGGVRPRTLIQPIDARFSAITIVGLTILMMPNPRAWASVTKRDFAWRSETTSDDGSIMRTGGSRMSVLTFVH